MVLKGIGLVGRAAVDFGGYGDIWKGILGGKEIAVKVLRILRKPEKEKFLKVGYLSRIYHHRPTYSQSLGVFIRSCHLATVGSPKRAAILWGISA